MKKAAVHIPNRVMNFRNQNLWVNTRAKRGSVYGQNHASSFWSKKKNPAMHLHMCERGMM